MEEEAFFVFYNYVPRQQNGYTDSSRRLISSVPGASRATIFKTKQRDEVSERINVLFDPEKYIETKKPVYTVLVASLTDAYPDYVLEFRPNSIVETEQEAQEIKVAIEKHKSRLYIQSNVKNPVAMILPTLVEKQ